MGESLMPLYDVKVETWVTVNAESEALARETVMDKLYNGEFSDQFEQDSNVMEAVLSEDQENI
jgi:DNA-dependent RNA polymerase auxiliary subunit epsilon